MSTTTHSVSSGTSLDTNDQEALKILGNHSLWFRMKKVQRWDLFFLMINIVLGKLFSAEFSKGVWETFATFLLSGLGYVLLASSLAEMISALPFSGGIYGLVRAFTHPAFGFFVACYELLITLLYLTDYVFRLSQIPVYAGVAEHEDTLPLVLGAYCMLIMFCILGGKVFWGSNAVLAVTTIMMVLLFIFGSISTVNFPKYHHQSSGFDFGSFMQSVPSVSIVFLGVQMLPLSIQYAKEPKKDIPMVMEMGMFFFVAVAVVVIVMAAFQYPGAGDLQNVYPLTDGFSNIFGISHSQASWLSLPGLFATSFGFMYCLGRQATCMAGSGLLPAILKKRVQIVHTPWVALLLMPLLCFLITIVIYYEESEVLSHINQACALASFVVFISFFVAYLQFKTTHSSLERSFTSPFGRAGAVLGIMVFSMCLVGTLGFQDENKYIPVCILVGFSMLVMLVFFVFLKGSHEFSEEEKEELFKAYLINANKASKNRLKKGKAITPSSQNLNGRSPRSNGLLPSNQPVSQPLLNEQSRNIAPIARQADNAEDRTLRDLPFVINSENVTEQSKDENTESSSRQFSSMPKISRRSVVFDDQALPSLDSLDPVPTPQAGDTLPYSQNQLISIQSTLRLSFVAPLKSNKIIPAESVSIPNY